jgi:hypothetical protein
MKIKIVLLTALFLAYNSIGFAQSNAPQQLRRSDPQMQSKGIDQNFGQDKVSVTFEKGIPLSTEQALLRYMAQHYKPARMGFEIYKLQAANDLYFVAGIFSKDQQAQDSSEVQTLFLVLKKQGATVSEVSKAVDESDAPIIEPIFFLGQNKLLVMVSHSWADGGFGGNLAFEYADNNLKSLGEIAVFELPNRSAGDFTLGHSPMGRATAEYKNNAYHLTMRGVGGSLYKPQQSDSTKYDKIASSGAPITYFYDGKDWKQVATKQVRRR